MTKRQAQQPSSKRVRQLQKRLRAAASLQLTAEVERRRAESILSGERARREAAQRGLVPYVQAIELFQRWLEGRPEFAHAAEPIMRELGLWDVKVGFDPDLAQELAG